MTHEILINVTPQETRVAMLEQAVVQELHVERLSARGLVGNIYLGRVARLSTQVSLAGRLLVFLPQDSHIGISQRIEDEAERETLRGRLQTLLPEGTAGGFIIRTMAETASEREMQNDIGYLTKLWSDLTSRSHEVPAPTLLYQDLNLALRVLRDMSTDETARVIVDSRETFVKMQEFARE